jgi:hypothetical protein
MTDDDARSLLAAYALDAVDDDERRAVEELVARDDGAAAELEELRTVAAALAGADQVAPPTDLRASVLAEVARTPQLPASAQSPLTPLPVTSADASTPPADPSRPAHGAGSPAQDRSDTDGGAGRQGEVIPLRRRRPGVVGWGLAAAAAAVVAVAVPGVIAWQQYDRAVQAEARADLLTELLAEPGATIVAGALTGGGDAVAVLTDARGAVVVEGLPELEGDLVYQVWAMRDGTPVPAGFLDASRGGAAEVLDGYRPGDGVALSVEPAGGSEQPTTTPLVVLIPG